LRFNELKNLCDPNDLDSITFSSFVRVVSRVRIESKGRDISLVKYATLVMEADESAAENNKSETIATS
jgi:hypothetical protein